MSRWRRDKILLWALRSCACLAGTLLFLIVLFLFIEAAPALSNIAFTHFITDTGWHPVEGLYNLSPMLMGTLWATLGALLVATPLGVLSAVFCHYYAPPAVATPYRRLIELLAGIPSVVYGFWGLVMVVPFIAQYQPPGASLLAGIIVLTLMILPTIALIADASFANVPSHYLHSAAALGLSRWTTVAQIILPTAKPGLITAIVLATGRAIGETMAVLMVCGNVVNAPQSVFEPIRTLTANIALEMAYAVGNHRAALFVSGLALLIMIVALIILAERANGHRQHA